MARPPQEVVEAAAGYVRVRVTDMEHVDLNVFRFDYDLSMAILLMNADGRIYHTFAGRDGRDAQSHLSMGALARVLTATLAEHASTDPVERAPAAPRTVGEYPWLAAKADQPRSQPCVHCHTVHDAWRESRKLEGTWTTDDAWVWPDPIEVGLVLDGEAQTRVVETSGAAAAAGVEPGDRIRSIAGVPVLTFGDVQRVLHEADDGATTLALGVDRADRPPLALELTLPDGWKRPAPETFAWRPMKWGLDPRPGFGGVQLAPAQLERLGLPADGFAFRVTYLVTWGEHAHTGHTAVDAGVRKGDVLLSIDGNSSFDSVEHFHAWYRLTRTVDEVAELVLLRDGERVTVHLPITD